MTVVEEFWGAISNYIRRYCSKDVYKDYGKLTEMMKKIAGNVIYKEYFPNHPFNGYDPYVQKEFYKVDVVGFYTKWFKNENKQKENRQSDYILEVALEHENNSNTWHEELCKLCYLCAKLKVIISYRTFVNGIDGIEIKLNQLIHNLGKDKLFAFPESQWLFIFGPCNEKFYNKPYRAFTIDKDLKINELNLDKPLVPNEFEGPNELTFPIMDPKDESIENEN